MSIKIYSGYDEFKYEEVKISDYLEEENYMCNSIDEDLEYLFLIPVKKTDFLDSSSFYVVSDPEDEETAEDISSYLGKYKKTYLTDLHKVVFFII